jgi:hypothetical protein
MEKWNILRNLNSLRQFRDDRQGRKSRTNLRANLRGARLLQSGAIEGFWLWLQPPSFQALIPLRDDR